MLKNHQRIPEVTLRIQDLEEHLRILKGSVDQESSNLSALTAQRTTLESEIQEARVGLNIIRLEADQTTRTLDEREAFLIRKEDSLVEKEEQLIGSEKELDARVQAEYIKLGAREQAAIDRMNEIKSDIVNLTTQKSILESDFSKILAYNAMRRVQLNNEMESLSEDIKELEAEKESRIDIVVKLQNDVKQLLKDVEVAQAEHQNTLDNTKDLVYNLEEREKSIESKEKSIAIIQLRLYKRHKQFFPNSELSL